MHDSVTRGLIARKGIRTLAILGDTSLGVTLDAAQPVILSVSSSADSLYGDPDATPPAVTLYDRRASFERHSGEPGLSLSWTSQREETAIRYRGAVTVEGAPAVELDIAVSVRPGEVEVRLEGVVEREGFELLHVDLRRVVSAHAIQGTARMVVGTAAGRLIDPARASEGEREHRYNWVLEAFGTTGLVYNRKLTAVLLLDSLDDTVLSSVASTPEGRFAGLGVRLRFRYPSSVPGARFSPHASTAFRLRLIEGDTLSPEKGWVIGARFLQERLSSRPSPLYRDTFIYKIFLGCLSSLHDTSFDQALEIVRRIHSITDGCRQVAYLVGFQHDGHDSQYPDVFTCNSHAGGMERLRNLVREAKKLNAIVSFHDNYDDAYDTSPSWDPADISVDAAGGLLKGGLWNGVQAYWNSMPVYAATRAPERIRRTLEMYPIETTYHLDVLTASVFRVDYRRGHPTGKDEDLRARLAIVEMFRAKGIDVTSEGCGLPFANHILYCWNMPRPPFSAHRGDRRIPFGPFVVHGHVDYAGTHADPHEIVDGLLYGALYCNDLKADTPTKEIVEAFYLLQLPLSLLRDETMTDYDEEGTRKTVRYSGGSSVEVDFESLEHEVRHRGVLVQKDFTCFAPGGKGGAYLYYRGRWSPPQQWALPERMRLASRLTAVALTESGEGEKLELQVSDGVARFDLPEGVPYRIG